MEVELHHGSPLCDLSHGFLLYTKPKVTNQNLDLPLEKHP